ncbi:MAG: nickel/cobalt transporter [Pseudomonadota bacterium]
MFSALTLLLVVVTFAALDLPTWWDRLVLFGVDLQRELHRDLAAAMRAVEASGGTAFWSLIGLGFLYGVFHAIGPGHGKVVISTYLATHESRLARGITLSLLSSLMQGLTAILLVGGVALIAERSLRDSQKLGIQLEAMSYGLVMSVGLFLIWRGFWRLRASYNRHEHRPEDGHGHAHEDDHGHGHGDGHTSCCHGHGPSADQLEKELSFREFFPMILSIGIRPCSGAILVLILALALHQLPAGIAAVVAMSIGTGLSISALAALSVYARNSAIAFANAFEMEGQSLGRLIHLAAIIGGVLIVIFGGTLLAATLSLRSHPLL